MKIIDLIENVKTILTKERELKPLRIEVSAATDTYLLEKGLKKTLARCRMNDAIAAVETRRKEITAICATLPDMGHKTAIYRQYAAYLLEIDELQAAVVVAETELEAANKMSTASSWKRAVGSKDTALVTNCRNKIEAIQASIESRQTANAVLCEYIATEQLTETEEEEYALWAAGGPPPPSVVKREEEWIRELSEQCVALPLQQ